MRSFSGRLGAFTLIELLTVMAIMSVLAGLLYPAFSVVRASAQALSCGSAQRQIALGIFAYVDEHEGLLPRPRLTVSPTLHWQLAIARYVDALNGDPAVPAYSDIRWRSVIWGCPPWLKWQNEVAGYAMTGYGLNWNPGRPEEGGYSETQDYLLSRISRPAERAMGGDSTYFSLGVNWSTPPAFYPAAFAITVACGFPYDRADPNRHGSRGANYFFYDGHVQMLSPDKAIVALVKP